MKFAIAHPKQLFPRKSLWADFKAGLVLGIEGVPDNLSSGVLAGINPVAAVYAGIFEVAGAAMFTSSALMPVQATGALSIIVRDSGVGQLENPAGALATLTILTGVIMIIVGALRAGGLVKFVSHSVTTGFLTAVGVNIFLGQFGDITGYQASDDNRIVASIDTLAHIGDWELAPTLLGVGTAIMIFVLTATRLGGMGYVVAIVLAWIVGWYLNTNGGDITVVGDLAEVPQGLPLPVLPDLSYLPTLFISALSLAFVALVQAAGVAGGTQNPDGSRPDTSQDFIGQGAGNIVSGLFRGMPVGGSASGAALMRTVGAKSRGALFFTAIIMAILIVTLSPLVALVPLPGLAGMLLVIGIETIPIPRVKQTLRTGVVPIIVMVVTFVLTMLIPLQFAVLIGVGVSLVLFVIGESTRLDLKQIKFDDEKGLVEVDPPAELSANEVLVIQPYGTVFFASASSLVDQLPRVGENSKNSVLILRLRGEQAPSTTLVDSLLHYSSRLQDADCRFVVVTTNKELIEDLGEVESIDESDVPRTYLGSDLLGAAVRQAYEDAKDWVETKPEGR